MTDHELQSMLVRASAGTGKTYQLTARLLKILLQGASPESILATTFTRKAAGEIIDRVLLSLADAADPENEPALEALREQVGVPTLPRHVCLQLLQNLLRNVHRLRICTLDSLFVQIAKSFPMELGLPPVWRLTDEIEETWMRERATEALIASLDQAEMSTVLAMLGKGEVRRSVSRELLQVVDAAFAVSRQCQGEVWKKLAAPQRPQLDRLQRAAAMMRDCQPKQKRHQTKLESLAAQLDACQFDALAEDTVIANVAQARRTHSAVTYYRSPFPDSLDESFDVLYAAVRSHVLSLVRSQNEATAAVLSAYDHQVTNLKHSARVLGFDDVAIRLAQHLPTLDDQTICNRLDSEIDHVLLDEFQDTSPVQWQVLRKIIERVTDENPTRQQADDWKVERSFFCVGDTKQAIFGWRGGVAEIFDVVVDEISGVKEDEQNTSYRSSPIVIDAVNRTFQNLAAHPMAQPSVSPDPTDKSVYEAEAIRAFSRRFPRHHAHHQQLPGYVRLATCRKIDQGDSQARRLVCFEDAAGIAATIHQRSPESSIGILMRTNQGVAQLIYMLENLSVDASGEGGNPLTDSAAVELVLSALMMCEHPGDGRWQFHVEHSPLGETANVNAAGIRRRLEDEGIAATIVYLGDLLAPYCGNRETIRLKQLVMLAIEYQRGGSPRIRDFARMVREKRVERPQRAAVRVMTIHQSKGLEFDTVILPELDAPLTRPSGHCVADVERIGEPPRAITRYLSQKSWHFLPRRWQSVFGQRSAAAMTEALCLLYVAMTRARLCLHMVIQPAKHKKLENRSAAALIYHSLDCQTDPSIGEQTLFELGDENRLFG